MNKTSYRIHIFWGSIQVRIQILVQILVQIFSSFRNTAYSVYDPTIFFSASRKAAIDFLVVGPVFNHTQLQQGNFAIVLSPQLTNPK